MRSWVRSRRRPSTNKVAAALAVLAGHPLKLQGGVEDFEALAQFGLDTLDQRCTPGILAMHDVRGE